MKKLTQSKALTGVAVVSLVGGTVCETAELPPRAAATLRAAAATRNTSETALAARILALVCRDSLVDAVLDDQQPRAVSRKLER